MLNSSGFRGQYKNAFVQRAALRLVRTPAEVRPGVRLQVTQGHPTCTGPRLTAVHDLAPLARFGHLVASDLRDVTSDPEALDSSGFWAVSADFEGRLVCARFADVRTRPVPEPVPGAWRGPAVGDWTSSLDRAAYTAGVRRIREHIAAGEVYQANLCRVLTAPLPDPAAADVDALTALLARGNPAPYAGTIRLPAHGVEIATASPELFLRRTGTDRGVRADQGDRADRGGPSGEGPRRERDDRGPRPQRPGTGLRHRLGDRARSCAPSRSTPASSTSSPPCAANCARARGGASCSTPRSRRARSPGRPSPARCGSSTPWRPAPRGPYCGGIGWVDADRGAAELAVGIRTFWVDRPHGVLRFGTGAGITWGSDPEREWRETELKASRLLAVASGAYAHSGHSGRTA